MRSIAIITALALFTTLSVADASDRQRPPKTYYPVVGEYMTTMHHSYNFYCINDAQMRVRAVVDSANAPALKDPNAIYVYQLPGGAHVESEQFIENRVLPECRAAIGGNVHVVGRSVGVPDLRR